MTGEAGSNKARQRRAKEMSALEFGRQRPGWSELGFQTRLGQAKAG